MDIVFNCLLIHHLLLREVNESRPNVISFELLENKVSFSERKFNLMTSLRLRIKRLNDDVPS